MANRYAVATGNWSNPATWDGGTLPGPGDDVRSNGFTVTINQSITVLSIQTTAASPAVAGGGFTLNTTTFNNLTLTCNIQCGTTTCLTVSGTGVVNIIGNSTGGIGNGSNGIGVANTPTINITGNLTGGTGQGNSGCSGLFITGSVGGTVNLTGNCTGGSGGSNQNNGYCGAGVIAATLNMTGIAYGGSGFGAAGIVAGIATTVTGSITAIASSTNNSPGVTSLATSPNVVVEAVVNTLQSCGIGPGVRTSPSSPNWTIIMADGSALTLTNPATTNPPAEADVRDGVIYGGGAYEGTLVVPIPADVRKGIATDNTVGTGIITGTDFFNLIATDSDPVAVRLRNVATVQTVGDQFNSF